MGINVTDTVEGVTFDHRAGGAPLLTFPLSVSSSVGMQSFTHVESVSSKHVVKVYMHSSSRFIIQVHWECYVIKDTKFSLFILQCVGSYSP